MAYYRVAENLLNFSCKSQELFKIIGIIFQDQKMHMVTPTEISLEKLLQYNVGQKLQIQHQDEELKDNEEF